MNDLLLEKRFEEWWQNAEKERAAFVQAKDYAFAAFCVGYEWARHTNSAERYISDMNLYSVQLELQVARQWAQMGNLNRAILHIELAQKYFDEVIEYVESKPKQNPTR